MYNMQKQAKQVKNELKNIHVEAEENGITVIVSGEQEIVMINIPEELLTPDNKKKVERSLMNALQKATKKSQLIAAEKMKGIMGSMGFGA